MAEINLSSFNLEYCKLFSADQLRKMYNGESVETLDALIEAIESSDKDGENNEPKKKSSSKK